MAHASSAATSTTPPQKLPWRDSWRGDALRARFRAAGCHLGISLAIASLVLFVVYQYWYAGPLAAVAGVGTILVLLLAVDVSLGPIMTFMVFDRRKKSLPMDLALIGMVQLLALGYGLHTVEAGRPHYLVFVKDRFEAVSRARLLTRSCARTCWWNRPLAVVICSTSRSGTSPWKTRRKP